MMMKRNVEGTSSSGETTVVVVEEEEETCEKGTARRR